MIKYHQERIDIQALSQNNIDRLQLDMIPAQSHVLEIGCATGYMTQYLVQEKGCQVLGVEPVSEQAETARDRGLNVVTGSIDNPETQEMILRHIEEHGLFQVIFMSQVIEHIADPAATMHILKKWLDPGGCLVISTCNIVHWKCRLQILMGRWEYQDYGIMDRSHLRFFTIKSFRELLEECGYSCCDFAYSFQDICPFKVLFDFRLLAPSDLLRLIPVVGMRMRRAYTDLFKNLLATQFVYKARVNIDN